MDEKSHKMDDIRLWKRGKCLVRRLTVSVPSFGIKLRLLHLFE